MTDKVLYSTGQGIARITLHRPEKRNALDGEMIAGIRQALAQSAADGDLRVVLLTGAGEDFCAGADLAAIESLKDAGVMENLADARRLGDLFLDMRRHPRPIVAAVRGRALAGGCGIATAADIVLAADSAQFGYPEVKIGFVPAMVMAMLRRSISEKCAFELLANGEIISASESADIGMINRVYPAGTFDQDVESYLRQLASRSPSALTLTKSLLYQTDGVSFESALSAGVQINGLARLTEDCRRGIDRFLKKS
jgi:methylglutaconyl-CoA hydratase